MNIKMKQIPPDLCLVRLSVSVMLHVGPAGKKPSELICNASIFPNAWNDRPDSARQEVRHWNNIKSSSLVSDKTNKTLRSEIEPDCIQQQTINDETDQAWSQQVWGV